MVDNPFSVSKPIASPPPANVAPEGEAPPKRADRQALALALALGKLKGQEKISDGIITAAMEVGAKVAKNPTDEVVDAGSQVYALSTIGEDPTEEAVQAAVAAANEAISKAESEAKKDNPKKGKAA